MTRFTDYKDAYRFIDLQRDEHGILTMAIHKDGGPASWSFFPGGLHEELGDAFYRIARDTGNNVVVLTGTGDRFLTQFDYGEPDPTMGTTEWWERGSKAAKDLLTNLLDIDVPVIGAANGPAFIHAELLTLSDLVIASDTASFADKAHAPRGLVPGDGVHIWWQMLLGPNRGRQFLWTGEVISAQEAKVLGFVAEVVPGDQLMPRVIEIAVGLAAKPRQMIRNSRVAFIQHIKRRMLDDLGYGLELEGSAILAMAAKS